MTVWIVCTILLGLVALYGVLAAHQYRAACDDFKKALNLGKTMIGTRDTTIAMVNNLLDGAQAASHRGDHVEFSRCFHTAREVAKIAAQATDRTAAAMAKVG